MKYAVIAMVAIYLVTFGCSPEEKEVSHDKPVQTSVEATPHGEQKAELVVEGKENVTTPHAFTTAEPAAAKEAHGEKPAVVEAQAEAPKEAKPQVAAQKASAPCKTAAAPCIREGEQAYPCSSGQPVAAAPDSKNAALENMIKATNAQVIATRQLVFATEQMISVSQLAEEKAASPATQ